jgi:hypothetical protein
MTQQTANSKRTTVWSKIQQLIAIVLCSLVFLNTQVVAQVAPAATTQQFLPLVISPIAAAPIGLPNGDFEQGAVAWTESSAKGLPVIQNSGFSITPRSGQYLAWLGGADDESNTLTQTIALPATGGEYLHYHYWVHSDEANCTLDTAQVLVSGTIVAQHPMCFTNDSTSWLEGSLDLRGYAGLSITLSFTMTTDESVVSSLFIDDVSLQAAP